MIISASRRTDIPAFFADWFMNRLREGYCLVPNPFNKNQVSRIRLDPETVSAIVFWTKNAAPMLEHVQELRDLGFRFYFQFTLNDYPKDLEPNIPSLQERLETFRTLAEMLKPGSVVWRYDPIIISNRTDYGYHREHFRHLCERLADVTERVVISIVDFYEKTLRNLRNLMAHGYHFDEKPAANPELPSLLSFMAETAREFSLEIVTCAEKRNYSDLGISPGACVDASLIERLWDIQVSHKKDPGQRKDCSCVESKDIGVNDSCPHACPYCYATRNPSYAAARYEEHDPKAASLLGDIEDTHEHTSRGQGRLFT